MAEFESASAQQERGDLGAYLRVWLRGAPFILTVSIALAAIAYIVDSGRESRYQASADVFLATQAAAALGTGESLSEDPERMVATQARLARLPIVAQRALESAGRTPASAARRRSEFLDRSTVDTDAAADILTFSVTDESPDRASQLASAYARAYTDYRRELDTKAVVDARRALEKQLATVRGARRLELESQLAELRSQEAVLGSGATLVRQADEPEKTQPKPTRAAVLGGMLGLALTTLLVFLWDGLRQRVRSTDEIEGYLDTPLLASIPKPPKRRGLVVLTEPDGPTAEAFQLLATNVDFANLDRKAATIMISSATRGEGKSTTAANLAIAFARRGRRVTLVDLDLREPTLAKAFQLEASPGLTNVLLGEVELEEAMQDVAVTPHTPPKPVEPSGPTKPSVPSVPRKPPQKKIDLGSQPTGSVRLLPSGSAPPSVPEIIASKRLAELLSIVRKHADLVLVDSPPVLAASDTAALSANVDALLVVVRLRSGRRGRLQELRRVIDRLPVQVLGAVATGTKGAQTYGYGRGRAVVAASSPVDGDSSVNGDSPVGGYCMKEKKNVQIKEPQQVKLKNGRDAVQGTCPDCGTKVFKMGTL